MKRLALFAALVLLPTALAVTLHKSKAAVPPPMPDLIVDQKRLLQNWVVRDEKLPASFCSVQEDGITPGEHALLRFTVSTPNIGTADTLKAALMNAKSIATLPASAAGAQVMKTFERLDISDEIKGKLQAKGAPAEIAKLSGRTPHGCKPRRNSPRNSMTRASDTAMTVKAMALPIGQLKPSENCSSMKCPIIAAPPPTKRGVT